LTFNKTEQSPWSSIFQPIFPVTWGIGL